MNLRLRNSRIGLFAAVLILLTSCRALGPAPALQTDSADEIQSVLDGAAIGEHHEANPALTQELESGGVSAADSIDDPELTERRFDLRVDGVPTRTFFHTLVADTPYNVVVHPDVKGAVSLDLSRVTVTEVIDIMRSVYGLDAVLQDSTFQIYPDALRTEIFQIDYLNITRAGQSEMQVSAGKVTDAGGQGGQGGNGQNFGGQNGNNNGNFNNQNGSGQQNGGGNVVGTIVNTSSQSDFWIELEDTLNAIIATDSGAQVVVTPQAGLAVVRAKPDSLAAVRSYLNRVQSSVHRQVILEAKILEVTLKEGFQAGINWNTFGEQSGGTFRPVTSVGADGMVTTTLGSNNDVAGEFSFGSGNFFNPLGSQFSLFSEFADFSAVINLLEAQGVVQVLSSPRIATVNNQKAVIKVGDDEFFVTDISTNTVTAGSAININDSPQLTPFFSGIALDVTPQISEDGEVILHVHPTVSEVQEQIKMISGQPVPLAASTIRESDSIIRARNGDIVVIGGLMQNSSQDSTSGIPVLNRLSGLGAAFRQRDQTSTKSELVILLRPIVIDHKSQQAFYRESAQRVSDLRRQIGAPQKSNSPKKTRQTTIRQETTGQ